jgi:CBS domain-containing protein
VVIEEEGTVRGILEAHDVLARGLDQRTGALALDRPVGSLLGPHPMPLTETSTVEEAVARLTGTTATALPLVAGGRLVGVVTAAGLLAHLAEETQRALAATAPVKQFADGDTPVAVRAEVALADPLVQNLFRLVSDAGI